MIHDLETWKKVFLEVPDSELDKRIFLATEDYKGIERVAHLGSGSCRSVFSHHENQQCVIKIPRGKYGIFENLVEEILFSSDSFRFPLARCRISKPLSDLYQIPILEMEYIKIGKLSLEPVPEWVFDVDSEQVGLDANGKLVAYDYADWGSEMYDMREMNLEKARQLKDKGENND